MVTIDNEKCEIIFISVNNKIPSYWQKKKLLGEFHLNPNLSDILLYAEKDAEKDPIIDFLIFYTGNVCLITIKKECYYINGEEKNNFMNIIELD